MSQKDNKILNSLEGAEYKFFTKLKEKPFLFTLTVIIIAFLLASILLIVTGRSPANFYTALVRSTLGLDLSKSAGSKGFFNLRYTGEWIMLSGILMLTGMSLGFAYKTGLWNIGAEGQYIIGMTCATIAAFYLPGSGAIRPYIIIIIGTLGGAFWGGVVGVLKARFNISEVVGTIMMNYIAFFLSRIVVRSIPDTNTYQTPPFPEGTTLENSLLEGMTNGSRLNSGIFIIILAIIAYHIILEKTSFGLSLKTTGFNRNAARYAGLSVKKNVFYAMAIAGAFAGLAGAIFAIGYFANGRLLSGMDGYGFTGIGVGLLGAGSTGGVVVGGLLFGGLANAEPLIQVKQVPREIVGMTNGLVLILISMTLGFNQLINYRLEKLKSKRGNK